MIFVNSILIKPYLKKFLANHCPVDPFVLSEKNRFGIFLLNTLRFSLVQRNDNRYTIQGKTEKMKVEIKECYERSYGLNISPMHQFQFNAFLLDEFHERMLDFVLPKLTGRKGCLKPALLDFRKKYSIEEDDLAFKTLEKMYEREKNKLVILKSA